MIRLLKRRLGMAVVLLLCLATAWAQISGRLRGRVLDEKGGVLIGAKVVLVDAEGAEKNTVTDREGKYSFAGLAAGIYTIRVTAPGFSLYENLAQIATIDAPTTLDVKLSLAVQQQEVTVTSEAQHLSVEAAANAGAIILRGADLDALPEDPEELADYLQALAGPSAGPNGGQFYIDDFSGGRLPPRSSIREIRINQNPFSSEYERLGFGRIEIFTKPGTDKFRGSMNLNFNDESLNSRNPFAPNRAPYQARRYGGHLSGPIIAKKASFFLDLERREVDENAVISATVLDHQFRPAPFSLAVVTPQRRTGASGRLDFQLNDKHTLMTRLRTERSRQENEGIGEFSLLSRAYQASRYQHDFSVTETAIFSSNLINETRLRFEMRGSDREGDNSVPTLHALDAFTGGGSQIGHSFNDSRDGEFSNTTSWNHGRHALKLGGRLRGSSTEDVSQSNFGGTFTFGGGFAPQLDENNRVVLVDGKAVRVPITSLERYRRTLLFQQLGMTPQEIRRLGGGATQFSIAGGDPHAGVDQIDFGGFIQDDWRLRSNLLLSMGLRYEVQTNIPDKADWAPRLAIAWSPAAKRGFRPKTVIRAGIGLFYDRFSDNFVLEADRYNGIKQQQFLVNNPDFFPNVPSVESLLFAARPQTTRRISRDLNSSYSTQSALSVERQLFLGFTVSASYVKVRMLHMLRSRNINAPLPETELRPLGHIGNVYEYQSDGIFNQDQLIVGFNNRFSRAYSVFGNYTLAKARSNTDGAGTFPSDPHDLGQDWGRSSLDVRHRFMAGGSVSFPRGIRLSPFVILSSGRPFNITTGRDTNEDSVFTERPAFATDLNKPGVIVTSFGAFDPNPGLGQTIIPRNFGEGPGFALVRLRFSKNFGFGKPAEPATGSSGPDVPPAGRWAGGMPGGGGDRGMRGGGPGGFMGFGGGDSRKPYNLSLSVDVSNLFNHTNLGQFIGNLSSPLFGQANSTMMGFGFRGGPGGGFSAAGNRKIELQLRFSF